MRWMRFVLVELLLAVTASAQPLAHYGSGADGVLLPDPTITPGATAPVTADQLCTPGYAKTARHVPEALKQHVYAVLPDNWNS